MKNGLRSLLRRSSVRIVASASQVGRVAALSIAGFAVPQVGIAAEAVGEIVDPAAVQPQNSS
jgi:hypothetical protein